MELGGIEKRFIKQAKREGKQIPSVFSTVPKLKPGLELYLSAFFDLQFDRNNFFDVDRLSWTCVDNYAKSNGFDEEQRLRLHHFVNKLDPVYIAFLKKKNTNAGKADEKPR